MTKLEKFLKQSAIETKNSTTTLSRYFRIGYVTIRLSDHVSNKSNSDIQIIIPTNKIEAGLYTVLFGNSGKVLIWNFKQIKEFLPSLLLMKEMNTQSTFKADPSSSRTVLQKLELLRQDSTEIKNTLVFDKTIKTKLKVQLVSAAEREVLLKPKSTWNIKEVGTLSNLLTKDLGRGNLINEDFQIFLNCTSVDYNDVLNIYKIIVIDNDKIPTIELLQEAYTYVK